LETVVSVEALDVGAVNEMAPRDRRFTPFHPVSCVRVMSLAGRPPTIV